MEKLALQLKAEESALESEYFEWGERYSDLRRVDLVSKEGLSVGVGEDFHSS